MQYYKHPTRRPFDHNIGFSDMKSIPTHEPSVSCNTTEKAVNASLPPLTGLSLAMAYVPYQNFDELNDPPKALECGTLFRELYMPFTGQKRRNLL